MLSMPINRTTSSALARFEEFKRELRALDGGEGVMPTTYAELERTVETLRNRLAECEQEHTELKHAHAMMAGKLLDIHDELPHYKKLATQRGARMQMMRDWMYTHYIDDRIRQLNTSLYVWFLHNYPEASTWFDSDGVPVED